MIILEFRVDEQAVQEDRESDPAAADVAVLEETYFVMPVRFCVAGQEMLMPGGWTPLPILGFARRLYEATRSLESGREARCYVAGGGDLKLSRQNKAIRIESPVGVAHIDAESLKRAAEEFLGTVRDFLQQRVPVMMNHKYWKSWFFHLPQR